ncbi:MAG: tRNA (cytidine(34)-2'-O)-methyltransferase [Granulosicoccus sp.]
MSENLHALNIVLFEPEIPPNTGNLIRLCANTGMQLHLVEPLGFSMDTKALRRAGLDYHESASVAVHADLETCLSSLDVPAGQRRVFAVSTRGSSAYHRAEFKLSDILLFGPETRGLPANVLDDERIHSTIRIPMRSDSRSLNLSNAVAIIAFEALRQLDFPQLA